MVSAHDEGDGAILNRFEQQMRFTQNKGQWDSRDLFRASGFASTTQISELLQLLLQGGGGRTAASTSPTTFQSPAASGWVLVATA